jgi:putative ABC transport system permease protein
MSFRETLRIALAGINANRLRSGLTMLGLVIGVAAVIVLVAVGNGSKAAVQSQIQALGTNVLTISSSTGSFGPGGAGASTGAADSLTIDDVEALRNQDVAPDVLHVAPVVTASSTAVVSGSTSYSPSSLVGSSPDYLDASAYTLQDGKNFTAADVKNHAAVAVIGPTVAEELSAGVGSTVQIGNTPFTVVGITDAKGSSGGTDADDVLIAPYTTIQDVAAGYGALDSIKVQATTEDSVGMAQAEVQEILDQRHPSTDSASTGGGSSAGGSVASSASSSSSSSSFRILNQASLLATSASTTDVFTKLLGAVAAISLLVGGIGVMNIMLVSVTERTREIGIRKAIGARRSDILMQFLTEALLVSIIGGLIGVAVGMGLSLTTIAGVDPVVSGGSVLLAFGASVLCGLFFGTYPATRAAQLKPIDALRFE